MPSAPSTVYAVVEAERTAFFRSEDRGESWTRTSDNRAVGGRPFYFSLLIPDPIDAKRVYKTGTNMRDATAASPSVASAVGCIPTSTRCGSIRRIRST